MSDTKDILTAAKTASVRRSFTSQTLMKTLGAELAALGPGTCSVTAPLRPDTAQQHGFAHAGLTFAIGDSAAGYAALTLMPEGAEVMTAEIKINLLAPAAGDRLRAEGRVIRTGRRLSVVQADVYAESATGDRHVAVLMGTMVPIPRTGTGPDRDR